MCTYPIRIESRPSTHVRQFRVVRQSSILPAVAYRAQEKNVKLHQDPHATNYWGNKEVGYFLKKIMTPGASVDWREHLQNCAPIACAEIVVS